MLVNNPTSNPSSYILPADSQGRLGSNKLCRQLANRIRMEPGSILILLESCLQTRMTYTIAVCTVKNSWWWTEELSENVAFHSKNKFEKLVRLVGFIIRKLVTLHGHMNVTMHGHMDVKFTLPNLHLPVPEQCWLVREITENVCWLAFGSCVRRKIGRGEAYAKDDEVKKICWKMAARVSRWPYEQLAHPVWESLCGDTACTRQTDLYIDLFGLSYSCAWY
jgi:hypothetical protein